MISTKKIIHKICEAISSIKENITTIEGDITTLKADYVVEIGTDNSFTYTKWASGKLEAYRTWNVGTYTVGTKYGEDIPIMYGATLPTTGAIPTPSIMISGSVEATPLGTTSNTGFLVERLTLTTLRIIKIGTTSSTLSNVTLALRVVNGRWK